MGRELHLHHRSPEGSAKRLTEAIDAGRARRSRVRRTRPVRAFAHSRHHELELQQAS